MTGEQGLALIVALLAVALMMALGMALVLTTMTETRIGSGYRDSVAALYAADGAIERVLGDALRASDLAGVLDGTVESAFRDGAAGGVRAVPGGGTVDLTGATDLVRADNPSWRLYGYGPVGHSYAAVWIAAAPAEPAGALAMLAHAYGPGGVRRVIEATAVRLDSTVSATPVVRLVSWRELR